MTTAEFLLARKLGTGGGDVTIEQLNVSENGTYSEQGKAYSPVIVDVPSSPVLDSLEVTSNGTYTPPSGVDGYNEVNVNVPLPQNALLLKDIPSTPTAIANFTDGAEMVMPSLTVGVDAWQEGSGDPSPSNVRPIHGWDEVDVTRTGKNLCNPEECASVQTSADVTYRNGYVISKVGTYTIKSYNNSGSNIYIYYKIIENGEYGTSQIIQQGAVPGPSKTITITEGLSVVIYDAIDESLNKSKALFENVQIEVGSTATTYEPYNGSTYTIDLNGTRYGGEVDVVSGVLTVTHAILTKNTASLSGSNSYPWWTNAGVKAIVGSGINRKLTDVMTNFGYENSIGANTESSNDTLFLYGSETAYTLAEWQALALDCQFRIPLATPLTIQLTPTAVKSLRGVNNLFADSGEILEGEYLAK